MSQSIKTLGSWIIIEQPPLPPRLRFFVAAICFILLMIGIKGVYDLVQILMGSGDGTENLFVGLLVTFLFTVIPLSGLWLMRDSGKTIIFDPKAKQARLTKRSLFGTAEKRFPFKALRPFELRQSDEMSRVWYAATKLPDKTLISVHDDTSGDMKAFAEMWQAKLNKMIAGQ